jgi:demethylmenaquinone methyltransferase/2-methoxy-6-polyprenyl-1,4-benzoquinol methylase
MSAAEVRTQRVRRFFESKGRSYDRVVLLMSLGVDPYWKRRILARVPREARDVLDLACGTGIVTCRLGRRQPGVRIVGVDLTEDFLEIARQKAARQGLHAEFLHANAETVSLPPAAFDCVLSSYLPKYVDVDSLLNNVVPALRPGGVIALHDFTYPTLWVARWGWRCYLRLSRVFWPPFFPDWKTTLAELPELIIRSRWVEDFSAGLRARGFVDVKIEFLTYGSGAIVSAKKACAEVIPEDPVATIRLQEGRSRPPGPPCSPSF